MSRLLLAETLPEWRNPLFELAVNTPVYEWLAGGATLLLLFAVHAAMKQGRWAAVIAMAKFLVAAFGVGWMFVNYNSGGGQAHPLLWIVLIAVAVIAVQGCVAAAVTKKPATAATYLLVFNLQIMAIADLVDRLFAPTGNSWALAAEKGTMHALTWTVLAALLVYTGKLAWVVGKRVLHK